MMWSPIYYYFCLRLFIYYLLSAWHIKRIQAPLHNAKQRIVSEKMRLKDFILLVVIEKLRLFHARRIEKQEVWYLSKIQAHQSSTNKNIISVISYNNFTAKKNVA